MPQEKNCRIAVIGIGCYYPGANSPLQLWENILSRRRQFREMPDVRLPNKEYYDPDPSVPNKTYQNKAAVLDGYEFNWLEKRIPKQTFESTDIVHWLALDTALQALADAKFDKENIPKETTGVILGNTLTGEFTRSNQMLLRWPYVRKALRISARQKGLNHVLTDLESTMEENYKSVFAPVTEDTLAGGLANTIAGRVCNFLDIHGGGYIVDGACSSSLLAIVTAANFLELNQMDMVIAGGVDISLDTFELIGFAKTGALTPDEMRVYDVGGKGFLPGEGCGMVVLKRLEDAKRDKDQIYAIINGWGISSDGKGGITAPSAAGQSRALIRAYDKAGFDTTKLDFIEGHGTGTTVGDKVELEGISIALNSKGEIPARNCGVTSFKSIVGHTKAAAGIGAFIKTAMAVNQRVLPPTAGLKDPNPIFNDKAKSIYPITHGQICDKEGVLYAGVSAMGFGGINSHVIIQSGDSPNPKLNTSIEESKLLVSNQTHELYCFTSDSKEDMVNILGEFLKDASGMSYAEMVDLAYHINIKADLSKPIRAAIVADTPFELERKIKVLKEKTKDWNDNNSLSFENNSIVGAYKKDNLRIGVVFPGQGSQKLNMNNKLIERNDWIKEILNKANCLFAGEDARNIISSVYKNIEKAADNQQVNSWQNEIKQTNIAQPAITLSSLLWFEYLQKLGINISCVSGHSLGELMAFYAAGFIDMEGLLKFSVFRGKAMAENGSGTMASLQCSKEKAEELISEVRGYLTIANLNSPEQTIVSGEAESIKNLILLAQNKQINSTELPVSAAFHSELVSEAGKEIKQYIVLKSKGTKKADVKLISSTNGKEVNEKVDLNEYFSFQTINKVDFISTVYSLEKNCDILLELGPGKVLSGLVNNISGDLKCFPIEVNSEDDLSINLLLANIFVSGSNIMLKDIYNSRLIREFTPAYKKSFLVNPLERPFPDIEINESLNKTTGINALFDYKSSAADFDEYIKIRGNFIKELIDTDYKYFNKSGIINETSYEKSNLVIKENNKTDGDAIQKNSSDIRNVLFGRIESLTGFSAEGFNDNMKLLDDFNLDSIKSGSLINGLAKSFNITGKINASELSNASLADIIGKFEKVVEIKPEVIIPDKNQTPNAINENEVPLIVYKMVAEKTGFPPELIRPEYKLLDDLNLDSIKAGALISEISKKFNIRGKIESAKLANANLEDIVDYVTNLLSANPEPRQEEIKEVNSTSWINAFSVSLIEEPVLVDNKTIIDFWQNKSLVLVHSEEDNGFASELSGIMKSRVSKVVTIGINNLNLLTSFENSCLLVIVPNYPVRLENVNKIVSLFSDVAKHIADTSFLGFIQFNDGRFLRDTNNSFVYPVNYSSVAFASSIHHERPDIKIRVIEVANQISKNEIPDIILKEFTIGNSFEAAGYDRDIVRRIIRYDHVSAAPKGKIDVDFNTNDVLIAAGGAKGITAECVLSFARKYKCKTALIGSSAINKEISNTISRFEKDNLLVRYYSCDISDKTALQNTITTVEQELGKITVVIHGAGKNIPRRAENVSFKEALDEISPKLIGAMNLCEVLKDNELKYFIALTSIIGITGMPGNSWYAFSNENMDLFLREIGKKRRFNVRTYAYSIWDEVGMGVRLGSNKVLAGMGIGSISPILGVQQFMRWIENKLNDQQIVITAGLGGLDTWNIRKPKLPKANRYISDIKYFEPGREIITRARLSRFTDLYIDDHNYGGSLLFPTVFGLEAMAQAAFLLTGMDKINNLVFENVSLEKPIVVPESGDLEIGIKATIVEGIMDSTKPLRIYAGVSTEHAGFSSFHFSAEVVFNVKSKSEKREIDLDREQLKISPKSDLYTWLLFQGPRFQNIRKLYSLTSDSVEFITDKIEKDPSGECFAESVRTPFLIGSPLLRDVLLQSVQLFLTSKKYLPVGIKRWELYNLNKQSNGGYIISRLNELSEDRGICNVEYIVNGEVNEKIEGYQVKALEPTPTYPDPVSLSDIESFYEKKITNEFNKYQQLLADRIIYKVYKHDIEFNYVNKKARHTIEDNVFRSMLSENREIQEDSDFSISRSPNGKPSINNSELKISISHSRTLLLMTLGFKDQGCDLEFVEKKSKHEWADLLDGKYTKVFDQLDRIDNDINISGTRLWCVREALIKSTGSIPLSINVEKVHERGVVFKVKTGDKDDIMVLTFPVEILPSVSVVFSSVVYLRESEMLITESRAEQSKYAGLFNKDLKGFSHSFLTTFKDCKGFFGKTHFTDYPDWMGTLRELVLEPIGKELLRDLGSGQFGMVTNTSEIIVFNEADTLNQITGNLWITNKSELDESFIDLNFEFLKVHPETNSYIRLAKCNLSTTWVKIEGRGIVKKSPLPDYFITFLKRYLLRSESNSININGGKYPSMNDIGKIIFENADKIRPKFLVAEQEFKTGISNSNTVGNLYYSNYYHWQSKIIEQYIYMISPEIMTNNGKGGEFLTLETNVKHLQEAMPFETIEVLMYVEQIYECAIKFHFEYFSKEGSNKRKLAYGSNVIVWAKRKNESSLPIVQQLPEQLSKTIVSLTLA